MGGQQNDHIIVSLVRTKAAGHLRDVRRLIVALSRARLGLYIFGRKSLFENCYELAPAFSQLMTKPIKLQVIPQETEVVTRKATDCACDGVYDVEGVEHLGILVHQMVGQTEGGPMDG